MIWSKVSANHFTRIVQPHELSVRGVIDVREAFIDASFAPAKKGNAKSGKRNVAREQRSWRSQIITDCQSLFVPRATPLSCFQPC